MLESKLYATDELFIKLATLDETNATDELFNAITDATELDAKGELICEELAKGALASEETATKDEVFTCEELATTDELFTCEELASKDEALTIGEGDVGMGSLELPEPPQPAKTKRARQNIAELCNFIELPERIRT